MNRKRLIVATMITLMVGACDGDETEVSTAPDVSDDAGTVTTLRDQTTVANSPQTTQETVAALGGSDNTATVTLGDETMTFVFESTDLCDTNYGGLGVWYVFLHNADGSGETLTLTLEQEDVPDFEAGVFIFLLPNVTWVAHSQEVPGTGIDSFEIDGNHATGTATFMTYEGDGPQSGSFDVTCAD